MDGVTPAEHAGAFTGTYTLPLVWREGSSAEPGPTVAEDEIVIEIAYEGGPAVRRDCQSELWIDVVVHVTTRDTNVEEMGTTTMVVHRGERREASLNFVGNQVALDAVLSRTSDDVQIDGTLTALFDELPSSWAEYGVVP